MVDASPGTLGPTPNHSLGPSGIPIPGGFAVRGGTRDAVVVLSVEGQGSLGRRFGRDRRSVWTEAARPGDREP